MKSNKVLIGPSDYLGLVECIYLDATTRSTAVVSDLRDLDTLRSRVENEGISFLTITLPQFCKDFERSLDLGYIDPSCFKSFKKHGAIPCFLKGMLGLIFNRETGRINDDQNISPTSAFPTIIDAVRQICLAFKKLEIPCSPKREADALENFIAIEHSFSEFQLSESDRQDFLYLSAVLWDGIMADLRLDMLVPRHGPGQTADKRVGNHKFVWRFWHERLEPFFPVMDSAYPISLGYGCNPIQELQELTFLNENDEIPVKVTPVPKTLKGPRIIAIEPCCMQYAQQGIRDWLYTVIESFWLTGGRINFRDQQVNQALALSSSKDGRYATIDLSDASDRVPRDLALEMFSGNPALKSAIDACRSTRAKMPDGRVISPLEKFASMGSALCFPVEAMYFYTICVMALLKEQNLSVSQRNIFRVSRDVYVYGDDIIVPTHSAETVLDYLQKYNCKVNTSKTFYTGKFRESCGVDAYNGYGVTPVYVNQPFPENRQQAARLISWVASGNLFFKKGFLRTATFLHSYVERFLGDLPWVSENSPALGRTYPWPSRPRKRFNSKYQRLEERLWVPRSVYRTGKIEGYAALMKSISKLRDLENLSVPRDALHLERFAVHGGLALTLRWVSPTIG